MALQALDQGIQGLVIPHIENVDDIIEFSSFTKYLLLVHEVFLHTFLREFDSSSILTHRFFHEIFSVLVH